MTVLITGSSRGIGRGLAEAYRSDGERVIGTERSTASGADAILDVTDPASHAALAASLSGDAVDLLICNAGVFLDKGNDIETGFAPELWTDTFAANVTGVFLTVQALLDNLRRAKAPKVAIISSQMGSSTRNTGGAYIYRASKAAALNLGRNLAHDLRADGIAVGIYHPGWVRTDMGGGAGEIDIATSVAGLRSRFDALTLDTTGCFETWDGRAHPF